MTYLLVTLHVLVCIALIIIVLLQAGKGAEIGASFGAGSSQTVFGAGGGKNFMTRMTTAAATIFMLTSLVLAYFWGEPTTIMPAGVAPPAEQRAPEDMPFPITPAEPGLPAPLEQIQPVEPAAPGEAPAPAGE